MIVSSDGKLSNAVVRRQLDAKFPSIMRKPNTIDAVFKVKAKFDTQNPIIGMLSTQIELGKLNNEKHIKTQLEAATSIKDFKIAEQLKRLRDFNQKRVNGYDDNNNKGNDNNNDNDFRPPTSPPLPPGFVLSLYNPPSPSISEDADEIVKGLYIIIITLIYSLIKG